MKVHELIEQLRKLGIENQDKEVTIYYDYFPRRTRRLEVEPTAVDVGDHYYIDYFPEGRDAEDGPLVTIVVLR